MVDDTQRRMRLARMAELYYLDRRTQSEIAERFGVSAMQVSRLLREAQKLGIVEFRIHHPLPIDVEPARELQARHGLKSVLAVRTSRPELVKGDVARAAAHHVLSLLEPGHTLAVAWSSTLVLLAQGLPYRPVEGVTVVQMLGAPSLAADRYDPYDAFVRIGTQLGARMHPLHAPTALWSRQARDALIEDPAVKTVLDRARAADLAICGIGTAGDDSTFFQMGYLTREELDGLRARGVVGDILGRFIDADGHQVPWSHGDMLVSLDLDELKRISHVIAVAAGPSKVRPILGALRGGYLSHLVTDADTVRTLLRIGDGVAVP
jgi:DNA-binding transcriptional regulator LsrR (DeoR family)